MVREGIKVLDAASEKFGFTLRYTTYDLGGERYLGTGETAPDSVLSELKIAGRPLSRRHRPSGRDAGHPRKSRYCSGSASSSTSTSTLDPSSSTRAWRRP